MHRIKYGMVWVISIGMLALLTACGVENKEVISVRGMHYSYKEAVAYGVIYASEQGLAGVDMSETHDDTKLTNEQYYKKQLQKEMEEVLLFNIAAQSEDMSLSKEEKKQVEEKAKEWKETVGKEYCKEYSLEEADFVKILEMKYLADDYLEKIKPDTEEDTAAQPERYVQVYQVLFPTVQLENGMLVSDADGGAKQVDETEKQRLKEVAEAFTVELSEGKTMDELAASYSEDGIATTTHLKYEDLSEEYKKQVDALSEGQTSGVFEDVYGYYVFELLDKDADAYGEALLGHEQTKEYESLRQEETDRLRSLYIGADSDYIDREIWKQIDMNQLIR